MIGFSASRWWGVVLKEFLQLRRDRVTFGMIVGIPIVQLLLFGYAINSDPKHLRAAIFSADQSEFTRSYLAAMRNSEYFEFVGELSSEDAAREALASGEVQFVVNIPAGFTRDLLRGEGPSLLIEVDATDPAAAGPAMAALEPLIRSAVTRDLRGPLETLAGQAEPFSVRVHRLYNPEGLTELNIVPGLMGIILTMTMVMMTGIAITRERERGTMENLLATPVRPIEVMSGKIIPYVFIGLIQATLILVAAHYIFDVPILGSITALYLVSLIFIAANLTIGIMLSSLAGNQLQAMQLTFMFLLPTILLSGFMFPFQGMPRWAQFIGELLPTTHFLRLVRGILLKGNSLSTMWNDIWPLGLFTIVVMTLAVRVYRRTLD